MDDVFQRMTAERQLRVYARIALVASLLPVLLYLGSFLSKTVSGDAGSVFYANATGLMCYESRPADCAVGTDEAAPGGTCDVAQSSPCTASPWLAVIIATALTVLFTAALTATKRYVRGRFVAASLAVALAVALVRLGLWLTVYPRSASVSLGEAFGYGSFGVAVLINTATVLATGMVLALLWRARSAPPAPAEPPVPINEPFRLRSLILVSLLLSVLIQGVNFLRVFPTEYFFPERIVSAQQEHLRVTNLWVSPQTVTEPPGLVRMTLRGVGDILRDHRVTDATDSAADFPLVMGLLVLLLAPMLVILPLLATEWLLAREIAAAPWHRGLYWSVPARVFVWTLVGAACAVWVAHSLDPAGTIDVALPLASAVAVYGAVRVAFLQVRAHWTLMPLPLLPRFITRAPWWFMALVVLITGLSVGALTYDHRTMGRLGLITSDTLLVRSATAVVDDAPSACVEPRPLIGTRPRALEYDCRYTLGRIRLLKEGPAGFTQQQLDAVQPFLCNEETQPAACSSLMLATTMQMIGSVFPSEGPTLRLEPDDRNAVLPLGRRTLVVHWDMPASTFADPVATWPLMEFALKRFGSTRVYSTSEKLVPGAPTTLRSIGGTAEIPLSVVLEGKLPGLVKAWDAFVRRAPVVRPYCLYCDSSPFFTKRQASDPATLTGS